MTGLSRLQRWYSEQCNGEWEEQYGVAIDTLDNPGWEVTIDLVGTRLETAQFAEVRCQRTDRDWVSCRAENQQFKGFGGPMNLEEILDIFLGWADWATGADAGRRL